MWQHRSKLHNLLTCIQLNCTRSLDWKQHWRDSAFQMLLIWGMRRKSWKVFTKRLSRMFQTALQPLIEICGCIKRLYWRKCRLNNYNVLYFSEIKCFQELFGTTMYKSHIVISLSDVVQRLGYGLYDRGATVIRSNSDCTIEEQLWLSSTGQSERFYSPPDLLFNGTRGLFPDKKPAELWSFSCTSY